MVRRALVAVLIGLAASPALACKGSRTLYEDNFAARNPAWTATTGTVIGAGKVQIPTAPNVISYALHKAVRYDKADICVDMTFPFTGVQTANEYAVGGGLIFLGDQAGNLTFNQLKLTLAGRVVVMRLADRQWTSPWGTPWMREFPEMNEGLGATNTLRVMLNLNRAHIYVNDRKIAEARVVPLSQGGYVGLGVEAGANAPVTFQFSKLKVTDLPQQ
jgi:hypothetical protein